MSIFNELKQQLTALQCAAQPAPIFTQKAPLARPFMQLTQPIAAEKPAESAMLLCLLQHFSQQAADNAHFPHFFWQSRNQPHAFATLGAVRQFFALEQAVQFSQKTALPLYGGLQFEGACRFILPRFCLEKNAEKLTACLYLDSQQLASEIDASLALLNELEAAISTAQAGEKTAQCRTPYGVTATDTVSDFATWANNIEQAIAAINAGTFRKVVLANATTFHFNQPLCPYDLVAISQQKNLGCYHFLWAENAQSAFIGASPERLYKRTGKKLHTEALAGTVAVSSDAAQTERNAQWLLNDPKNIHENQLVVDDIHAHLQDCVAAIEVEPAQIKRLHNVQHLRRKIQAQLKGGITDGDCLSRIQPTAAVAGLPRAASTAFITAHEGFQRGWYAGTFGYFTPNEAEFCVNLRSAQIQHAAITLYAGAGIVANSTPDTEWQEIERKSLAMAGLLVK